MDQNKSDIFRIAVTGPESTGKSTLSSQLAEYYQTVSTVEYARPYLDAIDRPYNQKDLLEIAKGQVAEEEVKQSVANRLLFCDTEMIVMKIWSTYKYGTVDPYIISELDKRRYDIYLLTDIDIPWMPDKLREHPTKRAYFFDLFETELKSINANYHVVKGNQKERLEKAIKVIDAYINSRGAS